MKTKTFKRIAALILSFIMMAAVAVPGMTANVSPASQTVPVYLTLQPVGNPTFAPGSTFQMEVVIDNPGEYSIGSISFLRVEIDNTYLEWTTPSPGPNFTGGAISTPNRLFLIHPAAYTATGAHFNFDSQENFTSGGQLMLLNLRVRATAPSLAIPAPTLYWCTTRAGAGVHCFENGDDVDSVLNSVIGGYEITLEGGRTGSSAPAIAREGSTVIVNAGEHDDWLFTNWTSVPSVTWLEGTDTNPTGRFIMPAQNVTVTANWEPNEAPLHAITVVSDAPNSSQSRPTARVGLNVEINAGTLAGHYFTGWTVTQGTVTLLDASAASTSFTMPDEPVIFTANFAPLRTLTVTGGGTGATPSGTHRSGDTVALNPGTNQGHIFAGWIAQGMLLDPFATSLVMPAGNVTITAHWNPAPVGQLTVVSPTTPAPAPTRQNLVIEFPASSIPLGAVVMDVSISWPGMVNHGNWGDHHDPATSIAEHLLFTNMPAQDRIFDVVWDYQCGWGSGVYQTPWAGGEWGGAPMSGLSPNFTATFSGTTTGFAPALRMNHAPFAGAGDRSLTYAQPTSLAFWLVDGLRWYHNPPTATHISLAQGLTTVPTTGNFVITIPNVLLEQRLEEAMVTVSFQGNGSFSGSNLNLPDVGTALSAPIFGTIEQPFTVTTIAGSGGTVSQGGTFSEGNNVIVTATPNAGYSFVNWTVEGVTLSDATANPLQFPMPAGNVTLTANFVEAETFALTVNTAGTGSGSVSPTSGSFAAGVQVPITATANTGYVFTGWSGAATGTQNPLNFIMPANAATVTANFAPIPTFDLTLNTAGTGSGSISASPDSGSFAAGASVSITATPDTGYMFTGWSGAASGTQNPLNFTMPANAATVTATFAPEQIETFALEVNVIGNGTVSPESGSYVAGSPVSITAAPGTNYMFVGWTGNVAEATGATNPLTFNMPAHDVTLTATFEPIPTFNLTVNVVGDGSVSPLSDTFFEGDPVSITATANGNYIFTGWSGDAVASGTASPLNFNMPAHNVTITATFQEPQSGEHLLSIEAGGTDATPSGLVLEGREVFLDPGTRDYHTFDGWESTCIVIDQFATSFVMPEHPVTLIATWAAHTFNLTVLTVGDGAVSLEGGSFAVGAPVSITATANAGYEFTGWSGDDAFATGTANPLEFNMPAHDVTITATFAPAVIKVGDLTGNGRISIMDVALLRTFVVDGPGTLTDSVLARINAGAGNVSGGATLTMEDVEMLRTYVMGMGHTLDAEVQARLAWHNS